MSWYWPKEKEPERIRLSSWLRPKERKDSQMLTFPLPSSPSLRALAEAPQVKVPSNLLPDQLT